MSRNDAINTGLRWTLDALNATAAQRQQAADTVLSIQAIERLNRRASRAWLHGRQTAAHNATQNARVIANRRGWHLDASAAPWSLTDTNNNRLLGW